MTETFFNSVERQLAEYPQKQYNMLKEELQREREARVAAELDSKKTFEKG